MEVSKCVHKMSINIAESGNILKTNKYALVRAFVNNIYFIRCMKYTVKICMCTCKHAHSSGNQKRVNALQYFSIMKFIWQNKIKELRKPLFKKYIRAQGGIAIPIILFWNPCSISNKL